MKSINGAMLNSTIPTEIALHTEIKKSFGMRQGEEGKIGLAVVRSCGRAVRKRPFANCQLQGLSCDLAVLQSCGLAVLQSCGQDETFAPLCPYAIAPLCLCATAPLCRCAFPEELTLSKLLTSKTFACHRLLYNKKK